MDGENSLEVNYNINWRNEPSSDDPNENCVGILKGETDSDMLILNCDVSKAYICSERKSQSISKK